MTKGTAARGTDSRSRPTVSPGCAETSARAAATCASDGPAPSTSRLPASVERNAARRAGEQDHAELLLELPHRLAHRGPRDAELPGGAAEALVSSNREERLKLRKRQRTHVQKEPLRGPIVKYVYAGRQDGAIYWRASSGRILASWLSSSFRSEERP